MERYEHFTPSDSDAPCAICRKCDKNEVEYGRFVGKSGINVHYFCLLLSTNLPQNGKSAKSGIVGFLIPDIKKIINDCKKNICVYCKENYASIKCSKCPRFFHLICGMSSNCLFEFTDSFQSFCHKHHNISHTLNFRPNDICSVCREPMGEYNPLTSIMATCCNHGWAHRHCLKRYALETGYSFKCIWCTSETNIEFRNEAKKLGIYIPDRDALFTMEMSMVKRFRIRHKTCDSQSCLCDMGRDYAPDKGPFELVICASCAASGTHLACAGKNVNRKKWICAECLPIVGALDQSLHVLKSLTICHKMPMAAASTPQPSSSHSQATASALQPSSSNSQATASNVVDESDEEVDGYFVFDGETREYIGVADKDGNISRHADTTPEEYEAFKQLVRDSYREFLASQNKIDENK